MRAERRFLQLMSAGALRPTTRSRAELTRAHAQARTNKHDLLCPRVGCASVILKARSARLVRKDNIEVRGRFLFLLLFVAN